MNIFLIRHALAGDRLPAGHDDSLRPLSAAGHAQAAALVASLADVEIERIVSSPSLRCVETVAPLAVSRQLDIALDTRLHEDARPSDLLELIAAASGDGAVVMSTHAEPLASVLARLVDAGAEVEAGLHSLRVSNASAWHLRGEAGAVTSLRFIAPPVPGGH